MLSSSSSASITPACISREWESNDSLTPPSIRRSPIQLPDTEDDGPYWDAYEEFEEVMGLHPTEDGELSDINFEKSLSDTEDYHSESLISIDLAFFGNPEVTGGKEEIGLLLAGLTLSTEDEIEVETKPEESQS